MAGNLPAREREAVLACCKFAPIRRSRPAAGAPDVDDRDAVQDNGSSKV